MDGDGDDDSDDDRPGEDNMPHDDDPPPARRREPCQGREWKTCERRRLKQRALGTDRAPLHGPFLNGEARGAEEANWPGLAIQSHASGNQLARNSGLTPSSPSISTARIVW